MKGAVIFDRGGILNADVGYPHRPERIRWIEGAESAVRMANEAGLLTFVATDQSGIGGGMFTEADVEALTAWMNDHLARSGARIDAFHYSPFHPQAPVEVYRRDSDCRKPGGGMILRILAEWPVDAARCLMIGDKDSDPQAAKAAGIEGRLFLGGDFAQFLAPLIAGLSQA